MDYKSTLNLPKTDFYRRPAHEARLEMLKLGRKAYL